MKLRLLVCTVLLALFVVPAFADSVTFTNQGFWQGQGQFSIGSSGVSATNALITSLSVDGMQPLSGNVGYLDFGTGVLTGSLKSGSFSGGNINFGLGTPGSQGEVFFSNFSGTLTKIGKELYDLAGTFSATIDGVAYKGSTNQIFSFSNDDDHHHGDDDGNGCWRNLHGTTTITTAAVPEPSTLTFLGTGLIALAGAVRRKLGARA
jgi:PEP-CTERM motif